ncbi:DUF1415 domain-containing protein [Ferrimonas lipolytica]|uniref:DUF1415 domain-containing protein n=1 Tax=Ferrimonas lipolytica TaxID=2724191 RepID=A0A6H1UDX4_9GAMM|nr:DUF1415 domain-containing protein [Ferrimonas lipolytica]QIZ77285.1 DUF1415 domain-containing protein [Ferrimonas lipolytica]
MTVVSNEIEEVLQTKQWLDEIVIRLNFCPFAKKEFVNNTIAYTASDATKLNQALTDLQDECDRLAATPAIETSLLIFTHGFAQFERFLELVEDASDHLLELGYEGTFQLANFHPDYFFDDEPAQSPGHYTNRSPYPTLHIIREQSMEKVLNHYPNPEQIPLNNIDVTEAKGSEFFEQALKRIKR